MNNQWTRKEFTTCGADPTVVVEWSCNGITITEFQNVYRVETDDTWMEPLCGAAMLMGEELHKSLEAAWQAKQDAVENFDHLFYGGE